MDVAFFLAPMASRSAQRFVQATPGKLQTADRIAAASAAVNLVVLRSRRGAPCPRWRSKSENPLIPKLEYDSNSRNECLSEPKYGPNISLLNSISLLRKGALDTMNRKFKLICGLFVLAAMVQVAEAAEYGGRIIEPQTATGGERN